MFYFRPHVPEGDGISDGFLGVLMLLLSFGLAAVVAVLLGVDLPTPGKVAGLLGLEGAVAAERDEALAREDARATPATAASSATAPFCPPGRPPAFVLGLAELKRRLGATMGEPLECEHGTSASGDTVQRTTTGLAYYRKETNMPAFTDGFRHWALSASGLVYWEGESVDPPASARPVRP